MKTFKWLLIVLLPLTLTAPCQHFSVAKKAPGTKTKLLTWFQTSEALAENSPPALSWNTLRGLNYSTGETAPSIGKFDGKTVSIPGFAVPIAGESDDKITEFLLVPEPMMCLHVPPPPPNQLVHVRLKTPGPVESFVPLLVSGRLKIIKTKSKYGKAGYEMEGTGFAPYEGK